MELSRQMLLLAAENYGSYYLHITKEILIQRNSWCIGMQIRWHQGLHGCCRGGHGVFYSKATNIFVFLKNSVTGL